MFPVLQVRVLVLVSELISGLICVQLSRNLKKLHVHVSHFSQDSTYDLFLILFNFFPKFELQNLGCSLSASAAYMPVFTVYI